MVKLDYIYVSGNKSHITDHQLNNNETELWSAYKSADYWVTESEPPFCIKIDQKSYELEELLKKHKELNWAYITAYNPQSKKLSKPQNIKRHRNLVEYCNEIGYVFYAGEGTDRNKKWDPETSLLIIGINISTAKKLGRHFQQKAILCGSLNQLPHLVPCH